MSDARDIETDEDAVGVSSSLSDDKRVDPAVTAQAAADTVHETRDDCPVPQANQGQPLTLCGCGDPGCFTVQCPNMPICQASPMPLCVARTHGNTCGNCAVMGLAFKFVKPVEDCCICYEKEGIQVHLPCGHRVCASCFRQPFERNTKNPEPQEFGCPEAGDDATEEEVAAMEDAWGEREPQQKSAYQEAYDVWEEEEEQRQEDLIEVFSKCPLCRAPTTWSGQDRTWT